MGQRILLVEDHQDTASAFSRMLQRDGHVVFTARSASEASRLCGEHAFDLLICDLQLPDGDGSELLKTAQGCHPETLGIVVSGYDESVWQERAREAGFSHFILKPIDYLTLRQVIAGLFRKN